MASLILKHVYGGYLRHYLLIALLILLIHALCTNSTGDDKNGPVGNGSKNELKHDRELKRSATANRTKNRNSRPTKATSASPVPENIQLDKSLKPSPSKDFADSNSNSPLGHVGNTNIVGRQKQDTNESSAKKEQDFTDKSKQQQTEKAGNVEELAYAGDEDDEDAAKDRGEIQINSAENIFEEGKTKAVKSDKHSADDPSSSSGFMTYFVITAVVVMIGYLIYHNKNKLMGYIVEGRNSSHGRRRRIQTTNDYKPLNNDDDVSRRIENA